MGDLGAAFASVTVGEHAMIAGAAFLASLISGMGGFGGGFVIAAATTPIVGAKGVVPLLSVFAFVSNLSRCYAYRRTVHWRAVIVFLLSSAPGVLLGAHFYDWAPERVLLFILGTALLVSIPARRLMERYKVRLGVPGLAGLGFAFGILSGTAIGSGMVVVASLLSFGLEGRALLGTDAVIGLANSAMRAATFRHLGLLPNDMIVAGIVMGSLTVPGTLLARAIVERMGLSLHTHLMEAVILAGGGVMFYQAVTT